MQIVTLAHIKAVLNITHTAQDSRLTYLANIAEGEILDYCYLGSMEEFYTAFGEEEVARAALQQAVLYVVDQRFHGKPVDVRGDPHVMRTLLKYRPPELSAGDTE
jgi:hypothetical protein